VPLLISVSVSGRTRGRGGREYSVGVDLDAFVVAHQEEWSRLEYLSRHGSGSGAEADEILDLYQRVATHLSVVRSAAPDPSLVTYLSSLLARARTRSSPTLSRPSCTGPDGGGSSPHS
jgi:hypothetical protein